MTWQLVTASIPPSTREATTHGMWKPCNQPPPTRSAIREPPERSERNALREPSAKWGTAHTEFKNHAQGKHTEEGCRITMAFFWMTAETKPMQVPCAVQKAPTLHNSHITAPSSAHTRCPLERFACVVSRRVKGGPRSSMCSRTI